MGYESRRCSCGRFELNAVNRIEELEQQLAEKDAEIRFIKASLLQLARSIDLEGSVDTEGVQDYSAPDNAAG